MADNISYADRLTADPSDDALWRDHRAEGIANCSPHWKKSSRLKKFAARIQWAEEDVNKFQSRSRKPAHLTLPETSRVLAAFSGRQILQRVEREYIPRHDEAARYAETMTKVDRAIHHACDGEQIDSAAFRDGPGIQGISWVRWFIDDWTHDTPQLKFETVPIWNMMWPSTREINLRDRAWQRWGSWWPQSTVKSRWPDAYKKIQVEIGSNQWTSIQQTAGKSSRNPWTGGAGQQPLPAGDAYDPKTRCFWVEYEEYRELVTYYLVSTPVDPKLTYDEALALDQQRIIALADPSTFDQAPPDPFENVEMSPDEVRDYRRQRRATHDDDIPPTLMSRKQRMVYRYIYGVGDHILESGDIDQGCFTYQAMAAEVVELEDKTLYISLLEDLEDAQRMVNYMMSALIRDIQINPKGTLFVEQGLFRNKDAALDAFTTAGGVIEIPRGRMGAGGAKPWEFVAGGTNVYSSKLENMLAFYREAIPRLAGFNPAALGQLGQDIRRVSGEVVRQLADATMTSNAERIDALRLYRREGARIFLAFARTLWEPEDLIQFIGESDAYDDVLDPITGEPTGERTLAIPPKEMWEEMAWREIAIEEVQPSDAEMTAFWDAIQTQIALFQSPMPDTGKPLLESGDWVKMMPKMPAAMRQKILARLKVQRAKFMQQQAQAEAAQQAAQAAQSAQTQGGGQPPPEQAQPAAQPTQ